MPLFSTQSLFQPTGIRFANRQFSEPSLLLYAAPPRIAGLYGILVLDGRCTPRPYRLIYIGESADLSSRGIPFEHHAYGRWVSHGGSAQSLYIAYHYMNMSGPRQRADAEQQIIEDYQPSCNIVGHSLLGLAT